MDKTEIEITTRDGTSIYLKLDPHVVNQLTMLLARHSDVRSIHANNVESGTMSWRRGNI